ncbi:MAG: hypothetical protein WCO84_02900 [bacterium]
MENNLNKQLSSIEEKKKKKEEAFNKTIKRLDDVVDGIGNSMDQEIKETVTYLLLLGFNTTGSCAGHTTGRSFAFPYINIAPLDNQQLVYNEARKKITNEICSKYNLTKIQLVEEVNTLADEEFIDKLVELDETLGKTTEYKNWFKEFMAMGSKIDELLLEFYNSKNTTDNLDIIKQGSGFNEHGSVWRVESRFSNKKRRERETKPITIEEVQEAQEEMQKFTQFLKEKYFKI